MICKIEANKAAKRKTLTLVYYAGHGFIKENKSYIALPDPLNPQYNLEDTLRSLARIDNSFVIGIFDCCRDAYSKSMFSPIATRSAQD